MTTTSFAELGLSARVVAAVEAAGYTTPTPIQAQAIPVAVTGRDILGIAQTGTGKTASFVLPMISRLEAGRARARMPRSLILAPTRELAAQVAQSFEKYGIHHKLDVALLIGGVSMDDQVRKLDRGVDVLIATPGRLLDHFQRGRIMLLGVEILVIDEADRMLDMGFIPDIEKICKLLPPKRQTLFFSATMPGEITRLASQFLTEPARIEVAKPATTATTITKRYQFCRDGEDWAKRDALRQLIRSEPVKNAIIFCNRKKDVAVLLKSLLKHGFNAGALHGDMDQSSRTATLDAFRAGKITLLAASDVAARGLDIPEVSHVFNFDVPWSADDYVHRIGRTGRAGREGFAATLVASDDLRLVAEITKLTGETPVWLGEAPTEQDFADAGKKKRRGGRGVDARRGSSSGSARPDRGEGRSEGRGEARSGGRDRSERGRPERRGEGSRERANAVGEERPPRETTRRPVSPKPGPQPVSNVPGTGPQPSMLAIDHGLPGDHDFDRPVGVAPIARPAAGRPPRPARPARESDRDTAPPRKTRPQTAGAERARPAPQPSAASGGFADNIPAFLRKPARPVKASSEG